MNPLQRWLLKVAAISLLTLTCAVPRAQAQPFGAWLGFAESGGKVTVPADPDLNPTDAFTFEAWINVTLPAAGSSCKSIAGKDWRVAWWVGVCNVGGAPTLRTYLQGSASVRNGGTVPAGVWTHVAVTFDGSMRRHYINGEEALAVAETGPLTTSDSELRIGSDVSWELTPNGSIDEVRLWNVARTTSQLRSAINQRITAAQTGLVAVWPLDANGNDALGGHHGTVTNAVGSTFPVVFDCGSSTDTAACLNDRFVTTVRWRTNPTPGSPTDGVGTLVTTSADSGLYWFFAATNWELMVKALNGCGLNDRYWLFSAATTNVFYRLEVLDVRAGVQKIYFNYPGPPAPAVTDTNAFATCP